MATPRPRAKARKPTKKGEATDKLAQIGIEAICERIETGESQAEIAVSIGVSVGSLSGFLARPEHVEQSARAREKSAEAWMDRGLQPLKQALTDKSIDASAARAYEQACARRAALRNPKYVEKTAHEHSGPGGSPLNVMIKRYSDG